MFFFVTLCELLKILRCVVTSNVWTQYSSCDLQEAQTADDPAHSNADQADEQQVDEHQPDEHQAG